MHHYRGEPTINLAGITAMLVTIIIWVGFLLSLRAETQSLLTPTDLGLMRFAIPALIFLPWLITGWQRICQVKTGYLLMIAIGGLPFFYLVSLGSQFAPAAHAGALVPGTAPLFVTGLAVLVFKEPLPRNRLFGLGAIVLGIMVLLANGLFNPDSGYWRGHLAFLAASLVWAIYTLGLRVAGINALQATALLCSSACVGLVISLLAGWGESTMIDSNWQALWPFLLTQGIGAGVIGGVTYGIAIGKLGAEKTAALGSLTPAFATVAAVPLLGEAFSISTLVGVSIIMAGVILASGIKWQRATDKQSTSIPSKT